MEKTSKKESAVHIGHNIPFLKVQCKLIESILEANKFLKKNKEHKNPLSFKNFKNTKIF